MESMEKWEELRPYTQDKDWGMVMAVEPDTSSMTGIGLVGMGGRGALGHILMSWSRRV